MLAAVVFKRAAKGSLPLLGVERLVEGWLNRPSFGREPGVDVVPDGNKGPLSFGRLGVEAVAAVLAEASVAGCFGEPNDPFVSDLAFVDPKPSDPKPLVSEFAVLDPTDPSPVDPNLRGLKFPKEGPLEVDGPGMLPLEEDAKAPPNNGVEDEPPTLSVWPKGFDLLACDLTPAKSLLVELFSSFQPCMPRYHIGFTAHV